MYNLNNYEYDCTNKCHCASHANAITSALTKRSISDENLAKYLAKICCNFGDIVDDLVNSIEIFKVC